MAGMLEWICCSSSRILALYSRMQGFQSKRSCIGFPLNLQVARTLAECSECINNSYCQLQLLLPKRWDKFCISWSLMDDVIVSPFSCLLFIGLGYFFATLAHVLIQKVKEVLRLSYAYSECCLLWMLPISCRELVIVHCYTFVGPLLMVHIVLNPQFQRI